MTEIFVSTNGVPIRLTDERWLHIVESHGELADYRDVIGETVRNPDRVLAGGADELLAVRVVVPPKAMGVVYRETDSDDGFVITAFLTTRFSRLDRRCQVWPR